MPLFNETSFGVSISLNQSKLIVCNTLKKMRNKISRDKRVKNFKIKKENYF